MTITNDKLLENEWLKNIYESVLNIENEGNTNELVNNALKQEIDISMIIKSMSNALERVGSLYEKNEYFMSELLICGDRAKRGIDVLKPLIAKEKDKFLGTIVFGSVKGDIHDIGKTIMSAFLIGAGFIVHDIGIEVTADQFVQAVKEHDADILAMSTLLTSCMDQMKVTIDAFKEHGLRDKVKIIIGGRPTSNDFAKEIGADGWGFLPQDAVNTCKELIKSLRK